MQQPSRDSGFTLIEVLVTISLMVTLMAIAVGGWSSWARASEQSGTARDIQSLLRNTQQQAVTEGRAMCVMFDTSANSYTVYRGSCDDATKVRINGPIKTASDAVRVASPVFVSSTSAANTGVSFTARGTAWSGNVKVTRSGASKVYTLSVEGLTGRVSLT